MMDEVLVVEVMVVMVVVTVMVVVVVEEVKRVDVEARKRKVIVKRESVRLSSLKVLPSS
ncbi:hypothetical protein E2C01_049372 [Portunus trituberculatus]|uniref:Uncharacterized protein n=1 Tax=Portunus trituberculatus TaxID=210409 RepID=A0A5B7GCZ2_PORTR|nr:hypothetical protein [Portunus trituberculatus]